MTTFQTFLSNISARDYIFQKTPYSEQIKQAAEMIKDAEYILIGAGSGLSTAAGLEMGGRRFKENFGEFIERYGSAYMRDMYSASFYDFPTEEEKWAFWSKMGMVNRIIGTLPLYEKVQKLTESKRRFVLTTNVDHQFYFSGFGEENIFATQGDYGLIQCRKACHQKTYDATGLFSEMDKVRKDCRIPSDMVPKCPVCGGIMEMNLRNDMYFVEDDAWHEAERRFGEFLNECIDKKTLLLELGVGFNTPVIIRFPFEKLMREHKNMSLVRLNLDEAFVPAEFGVRAAGINEDIEKSIDDLLEEAAKYDK